jgi:hypothetical protein
MVRPEEDQMFRSALLARIITTLAGRVGAGCFW